MAIGENSPLIEVIRQAETTLGTQVRAHLSQRRWERDPIATARQIFSSNQPLLLSPEAGILFYFNLKRRVYAVVSDPDWHAALTKLDWLAERRTLQKELSETHLENALARMLSRITQQLADAQT